MILLISAIVFTLMPTSRNTWRGRAFLLGVGQKRIGVSLNRRVKIELAKTHVFANSILTPRANPILTRLKQLTGLINYKAHVSLPSSEALSVHVQYQCVMGNPIENSRR